MRRVERQVDGDGREHAAQGAEDRQDCLADVGELAGRHLVLDLEAHEQEEHGHEDVVDDVRERHLTMEGADADGDLRMPELEEGTMRRRVGDDERDDGGKEHDRRGLGGRVRELDELAQTLVTTLHLGDEQPVWIGIVGTGNDRRIGEVLVLVRVVVSVLVGHQKLLASSCEIAKGAVFRCPAYRLLVPEVGVEPTRPEDNGF